MKTRILNILIAAVALFRSVEAQSSATDGGVFVYLSRATQVLKGSTIFKFIPDSPYRIAGCISTNGSAYLYLHHPCGIINVTQGAYCFDIKNYTIGSNIKYSDDNLIISNYNVEWKHTPAAPSYKPEHGCAVLGLAEQNSLYFSFHVDTAPPNTYVILPVASWWRIMPITSNSDFKYGPMMISSDDLLAWRTASDDNKVYAFFRFDSLKPASDSVSSYLVSKPSFKYPPIFINGDKLINKVIIR